MQLGPSHGLRSYFQSKCIGQISQCSCAVMIRTARRLRTQPKDARASDERDIVKVHDVGVGLVETVAKTRST